MRDDIHKGAPVKKHWKTLAQIACGKFATWLASGSNVATYAAEKEAESISAEILNHVAEALEGNSLPFVAILPQGKTDAEKVLISMADYRLSQGERPDLRQLLEQTLVERTTQVSRELRCHAARIDPDGAKSFMMRLNKSLISVSMSDVAHQRLLTRNQSVSSMSTDLRSWNVR